LGLIWAVRSAPRLTHIFHLTVNLSGPLDLFLRLRYIRWKVQIHLSHLLKLCLIMHVRSIPRFARPLQYSCLCVNTRAHLSLWLLCWPPRWDSRWRSLPVTGAPSFWSDEPSSVVSLSRTFLSHLIEDRYGASLYTGVPFPGTVPVRYRLNINSQIQLN
jgi:hypothetical protein